ncbi:TetR/AcrR family transcriptional regulator [Streptosporangium sp. NPDC003464]
MSRREEITDVAIAVLAAEGMRGLTHRTVDRAAGLPEGSTSYYFRTRQALLQATVHRLAEGTAADLAALKAAAGSDLEGLVEAVVTVVGQWLTTGRDRQLARYELSLEAVRRPELHRVLMASGDHLREMITELLASARVPEAHRHAVDLIAFLDGVVFDRLVGMGARADAPDLRATIRMLLAVATRS